jgi:hypothetical protein
MYVSTEISSGFSFSASNSDILLSFQGALGHGNKRFQLFPLTVNKLKGESIVAVAGGGKSTYAVTESGSSSFAFDFKPYVDNELYSDLTIMIGDKSIKAHKAIVFARCPYVRLFSLPHCLNFVSNPDILIFSY